MSSAWAIRYRILKSCMRAFVMAMVYSEYDRCPRSNASASNITLYQWHHTAKTWTYPSGRIHPALVSEQKAAYPQKSPDDAAERFGPEILDPFNPGSPESAQPQPRASSPERPFHPGFAHSRIPDWPVWPQGWTELVFVGLGVKRTVSCR